MNDRLISLNAAIDALDKVAEMFPYRIPGNAKTYRQYNEAWSDAIDAAENALEALPPAQPGWIPCSERCPEQSGWYLVSLKNGNVQKAWYRVAPINQGGSYWRSPIKRPLAWMPLPKPWEGGQDEQN